MEVVEEGGWWIHLLEVVAGGLEDRLRWSGTRYRRQWMSPRLH